jgi:hypothetical protein
MSKKQNPCSDHLNLHFSIFFCSPAAARHSKWHSKDGEEASRRGSQITIPQGSMADNPQAPCPQQSSPARRGSKIPINPNPGYPCQTQKLLCLRKTGHFDALSPRLSPTKVQTCLWSFLEKKGKHENKGVETREEKFLGATSLSNSNSKSRCCPIALA